METILQNSETVEKYFRKQEISESLSGSQILIPGLRPISLFPPPESLPDKSELTESDSETETPKYTVADIFRLYWDDYRNENSVTNQHIKTVYDILNCRTGHYGYNISMCDTCGHTEIYANSCRNRHCPSCQGNKRKIWADERVADLLPVPYYHAVLTITDQIFPMCLYNQKVIYDLIPIAKTTLPKEPTYASKEIL